AVVDPDGQGRPEGAAVAQPAQHLQPVLLEAHALAAAVAETPSGQLAGDLVAGQGHAARGLNPRPLADPVGGVGEVHDVGGRGVLEPGVVAVVLEVAGAARGPDRPAPLLGDSAFDGDRPTLGALVVFPA